MSIVRDAARWIFVAALIYAPWAYGGTTSTSIQIINWLLLAAFILWIIELVVSRRRPMFLRLDRDRRLDDPQCDFDLRPGFLCLCFAAQFYVAPDWFG